MTPRISRFQPALLALAAALLLTSPAAAATKRGAPITDANIAAIVLAANTIDIDNGQLALKTSTSESVKGFAQMMVTDHTSVNDKAKELATRLNLTPKANGTSRSLTAQMKTKRMRLGRLSGAAFDKAYMDNEITYHQSVLSMLDDKLVPNAKNAELKDLLTSVRPTFVQHLEHAKEVRGALGN